VPKAGGGLYNETDSKDARCVKIEGGKCFNNYYKDLFKDKIQETLSKHMDSVMASKLAAVIKKESGLNDLLEYSRSVHAEMDAIITAARLGSTSIAGGYIYTTTYPCHHCARHIISSGINKVFYIEPYEKSLAKELHSDAIAIDPEEENPDIGHVKFLHFEGISPRQYQYFFYPSSERKDSAGKAMSRNIAVEGKIINELLDDYRSLESRVTDYLKSNLEIPEDLLSS
jgi:deoxycytidylate deaminase